MNDDYARFEVVVKDDGSVRIIGMSPTPEHCFNIEDALKSIEQRLNVIKMDMKPK